MLRRARLSTPPAVIVDLLLRRGRSGLSVRRLRATPRGRRPRARCVPARSPPACRRSQAGSTSRQPLVLADLDRLAGVPLPEPGADGDALLLIGRRHQRDCNSWMHNAERLTRGKPRHQLFMHPDDLAARGLADGALGRGDLRRRPGRGRGGRHRRRDARRGQPPARLRPRPRRQHGHGPQQPGARRLHQRPDGPDAPRRLRQRGPQRRARHGPPPDSAELVELAKLVERASALASSTGGH